MWPDLDFTAKAGAQRYSAEHGLMIVAPDTSPRGDDVADDDAYYLSQGAGFYVDAQMSPWSANFLMYSYVTEELPPLIADNFAADRYRQGIFGHSMGGRGALVCALRNPYQYQPVSAFAPIVAPSVCPWGVKEFTVYFAEDRDRWRRHDAFALIRCHGNQRSEILADQETAAPFLEEELKPELLREACAEADQPLTLHMQEGYDHSYYFIATFMTDHIAHHAKILKS